MRYFHRILLCIILCAATGLQVADRYGQVLNAGYVTVNNPLANEDGSISAEPRYSGTSGTTDQQEAARINRRYHERMAAFCAAHTGMQLREELLHALSDQIIYGIRYNSVCLSSYYDFLFRLCLF